MTRNLNCKHENAVHSETCWEHFVQPYTKLYNFRNQSNATNYKICCNTCNLKNDSNAYIFIFLMCNLFIPDDDPKWRPKHVALIYAVKWNLRLPSSELSSSVRWFDNDVSKLPKSSISRVKLPFFSDSLTLENKNYTNRRYPIRG